jgi:hypothetical protein
VFCGGAADFLHKVLKLFGVDAFQLNYGDVAFFTHAVVVIPVAGPDATDYRILDPTFNVDYSISWSGAPASVQQMFEIWRAERMDLLSVNEQPLGTRWIVAAPDQPGTAKRCEDGAASTGCGLDAFRAPWAPVFEQHGHTTDDAGLVRLLGTTEILYPQYFSVPDDFVRMHTTFRQAVLAHDASVHVAYLPLPPETPDAPEDVTESSEEPLDPPGMSASTPVAPSTASEITPPLRIRARTVLERAAVRHRSLRFVFSSNEARRIVIRIALKRNGRWWVLLRPKLAVPVGRSERRVELPRRLQGARRIRVTVMAGRVAIARRVVANRPVARPSGPVDLAGKVPNEHLWQVPSFGSPGHGARQGARQG